MKPHTEMIEGPEAFERFRNAVKTILSAPKSVVLKDQKKREAKRRKPAAVKS